MKKMIGKGGTLCDPKQDSLLNGKRGTLCDPKQDSLLNGKRGQMDLPFNWIFALILIIVFIATAMWGIGHFKNLSDCSRIGMYMDTLQREVDKAYTSSSSDFDIEYIDLPGIEKICFANLSQSITGSIEVYDQISIYDVQDANTFLVPPGKSCDMAYKKIKHLDIATIIKTKNPYCIDVAKGSIGVFKDYYGKGVILK